MTFPTESMENKTRLYVMTVHCPLKGTQSSYLTRKV